MLLAAGLCLLGAGVVWQNRAGLPRLLLQPSWLIALLVLDVLLLAFRLLCVADAYRLGASGGAHQPLAPARPAPVIGGLALVLVATIAPHAAVGYYDVQAYDLLTSVFHQKPRPVESALAPAPRAGPAAVPGPITILLVGGDAGPGRIGLRADTMIVVRVEPSTGRVVLYGLPRNLVRVPLPDGPARAFRCRCFPRPLNELYAFAQEHPELFPGNGTPGVNALRGVAQRLLGIPIDYYALVDLQGFVDVVDALGGVTLWTTETIRIEIDRLGKGPGPAFDLQPGRQHLDGLTALAYVRSRKTTSDYDRMRRQRCLLGALARQADTRRMLRVFPKLARVVKRDVSTDIPLDQLPSLIGTTSQHRPQIKAIGFTPPDYVKGWAAGGYPIPDVARIRRTVRATLHPPEADPEALAAPATPMPSGAATSGAAARAMARPSAQAADPCRPLG
ncbi:MAG TPA: LCP family protein [Actinomycetes bacterium]|jgi:LCP family protein required for cell wall assembly|nr:LCP family protein [Actinomycetes bacterium]